MIHQETLLESEVKLIDNVQGLITGVTKPADCLLSIQKLYVYGATEDPLIADYLATLGRFKGIKRELVSELAWDVFYADMEKNSVHKHLAKQRWEINWDLAFRVFGYDQRKLVDEVAEGIKSIGEQLKDKGEKPGLLESFQRKFLRKLTPQQQAFYDRMVKGQTAASKLDTAVWAVKGEEDWKKTMKWMEEAEKERDAFWKQFKEQQERRPKDLDFVIDVDPERRIVHGSIHKWLYEGREIYTIAPLRGERVTEDQIPPLFERITDQEVEFNKLNPLQQEKIAKEFESTEGKVESAQSYKHYLQDLALAKRFHERKTVSFKDRTAQQKSEPTETGKTTGTTSVHPIEPGIYKWASEEADFPVKVIKSLGVGSDGREYVQVEGSSTGIPADQLVRVTHDELKPPTSMEDMEALGNEGLDALEGFK